MQRRLRPIIRDPQDHTLLVYCVTSHLTLQEVLCTAIHQGSKPKTNTLCALILSM